MDGLAGPALGAIAGPSPIVFALTVVTCGAMVKGGPAGTAMVGIFGITSFYRGQLAGRPVG
jgi:hypothetical protein